ncbi:MAG: T9SS type A sorting domain-containing protein [Prolixibacteraceae bacterium]|jgi:hypothetical protein|nr:T9SS type A sorting domain-containing protein [Prolixibacteraceae bacterium]
MIESGEKQKRVTEQFRSYSSDLISFKKAKAWNAEKVEDNIFTATTEIDMPIIGGRVRSSLVDTNNDIALVAPSGGGIWSFNAEDGSSFIALDDFGSFLSITFLAQNPFNPNTILAATGDELHGISGNGVFRSSNDGKSFSLLTSTDPENNSDFNFIRFIKYSPNVEGVIYLAAKNKLFKSTNSGEDWTEVFSASNNIRSLEFMENDKVILAVYSEGLYVSDSGDEASFSNVTADVPNDADGSIGSPNGVVVASHAANRKICFAFFTGSNGNSIYKTSNNGMSWTKVSDPTFNISQTWFCLTIGVHPTDSNKVVAGSVGWGYTTNGGSSWFKGVELEVDFHDVHFHNSNPDVAYLGYDQGIGRIDFSKTHEVWVWYGSQGVLEEQIEQLELGKNPGFNTSQIYYGDYYPEEYGDAHIFGQQDGGCFVKVNNIEKRILVGDGGSVFINKQNPEKAFASTQYGVIKSTEKALEPSSQDFNKVQNLPGEHPHFITQFAGNNADGNQIYIPQETTIERTIDNGASFTSIASHNLRTPKVAVENKANPIVYVVGKDANDSYKTKVIKINNAAASNYSSEILNLSDKQNSVIDHVNIDPNSNSTIYVTFYSGEAYNYSILNLTSSEKSLKENLPDVAFNTVIGVKDEPNLLIAGTNIGVFYSINAGENWTLSGDFPYTQITDIKLRESDNRLFVFTYGRGTWASTLDNKTTDIENNKTVENKFMVYSNPATDFIHLNNISINNTEVDIFDIDGRMILQAAEVSSIDVSQLSKGIYVLHLLRNGVIEEVEKIMVQ